MDILSAQKICGNVALHDVFVEDLSEIFIICLICTAFYG